MKRVFFGVISGFEDELMEVMIGVVVGGKLCVEVKGINNFVVCFVFWICFCVLLVGLCDVR